MSDMLDTTPNWWDTLTKPHNSITDTRRMRRVRTLSALTLILTIAGVLYAALLLASGGTNLTPVLVAVILFIGSYILSRSAMPVNGAWTLVVGTLALNFVILSTVPEAEFTAQFILFLALPILLSILLLSSRVTIILSVVTAVAALVFVTAAPWVNPTEVAASMVVSFIIMAVASLVAILQGQDVETIEGQAVELNTYSQSLQTDVDRMSAISDIGRAITGSRELDTLLARVVNMIIDRFEYTHAQVFLVDENEGTAILTESTGTIGAEIKARGHRIDVGSQTLIGQVTSQGQAMIATEADTDEVRRSNELIVNARSEMALPLRAGTRIIGALDIQSGDAAAFDQDDISVFQAMADQLGVAVENARLFEDAQRDLSEIQVLNRQLTGEAWQSYLRGRGETAAIGYGTQEGKIIPLTDEPELIDTANTVSLPLNVRGETIGMLDVTSPDGAPPDQETQALLSAVAERVALALDGARLGEQAQRQANREQILNQLSEELQATTDLNIILRIVAREASRAMGTSRGFVYLASEIDQPSGE